MIAKGYIFTYLYIFAIFGISSLLYSKGNGTLTRKLIHIGVSFCFIIFYKYFGTSIHLIVPPFTFIILNYISYKKNILKSMEEDSSLGTVYYAVSLFIMGLITYFKNDFYYAFGIGWFVMAFGDGLAPIVSKYINSKKIYSDKTIAGSLTVLLVSLMVIILFNMIFNLGYGLEYYIIIPFSSLFLELIGRQGTDNLTLPLGVALITYLLGVM